MDNKPHAKDYLHGCHSSTREEINLNIVLHRSAPDGPLEVVAVSQGNSATSESQIPTSIEAVTRLYISDLSFTVDNVLMAHLTDTLPDIQLQQLSNDIIRGVLHVTQGGEGNLGYHLIPNRGEGFLEGISITPYLLNMFDSINN